MPNRGLIEIGRVLNADAQIGRLERDWLCGELETAFNHRVRAARRSTYICTVVPHNFD
jgi:hypothetical protein